MNIVIVGAKDRKSQQERDDVNELMDMLIKHYPGALFITMLAWEEGIGRFVKEKCREQDSEGRFKFKLVEANVRVYASDLSQSEVSQIYIGRNATLFEIGDVLYYFASPSRKGTLENLVERMVDGGRPTVVFLPGDQMRLAQLKGND